ncbi:MAG: hypothetical protein DBX44_03130 [Oscillospiraceae bacterium]|nr:MAG: hypothetical protein DBX44_03130 [Oscillospiraceae bacterium]
MVSPSFLGDSARRIICVVSPILPLSYQKAAESAIAELGEWGRSRIFSVMGKSGGIDGFACMAGTV